MWQREGPHRSRRRRSARPKPQSSEALLLCVLGHLSDGIGALRLSCRLKKTSIASHLGIMEEMVATFRGRLRLTRSPSPTRRKPLLGPALRSPITCHGPPRRFLRSLRRTEAILVQCSTRPRASRVTKWASVSIDSPPTASFSSPTARPTPTGGATPSCRAGANPKSGSTRSPSSVTNVSAGASLIDL